MLSSFLFPCLISSFMTMWPKKVLEIIYFLLNLLRLVLWPRIWLILVYVLRELEKTMYSAVIGWSVP